MTKFRKVKKIVVKNKQMDESFESDNENYNNFWDLLNSFNAEEIASSLLMNITQNQKIDLNSLKSVNVLVEKLQDSEPQVVINILNGIKNLSENDEFYQNLVKTDLINRLKEIIKKQQSNFSNDDIQQKILSSLFELCSFLCEITPLQYAHIWDEIFEMGIQLIVNSKNYQNIVQILNFINVLSESNEQICLKIIKQNQIVDFLVNLVKNQQNSLLSSYTIFILFNVVKNLENLNQFNDNNDFKQGSITVIELVEQQLFNAMSIKIFDELKNFKNLIENSKESSFKALDIWIHSSQAIQVHLGLLITIFEQDQDDDFEDQEDNQNFYEQPTEIQSQIQNQLQQKFNNQDFLGLIFDKLKFISDVETEFLQDDQDFVLTNCLNINNLCLSFISNLKNLNSYGLQIFNYLWIQIKNQNDSEILIQSLKIFYQLIQDQQIQSQIQPLILIDQLQQILLKFENEEEIILVSLDILSFRFQPKYNNDQNIFEIVTDIFIKYLQSQNIMIAGQALNGIFDIFQDEQFDVIFKNKQLMIILQQGYEQLKHIVQTLKGKQNYSFLKDCCNNLKRFIQYKKEQGL